MPNIIKVAGVLFAPVLVISMTATGLAEAQTYEAPPTFRASDILAPDMVSGPHHKIAETVENDGVLNRFQVETPQGPLTVVGTDRLMIRLHEVEALQQMEEVKRGDVFVEALKNSAKAPLELAKGLITDTGQTISDVGKGAGDFFDSVGHSLFGSPSEEEAGTIETVVGYDAIKRKFAYEFGVDPYTNYEALQERLIELSRAALLGGITTKVAFAAIPNRAASITLRATSFSEGMRKLVRDTSPAELKQINAEKLAEMGVDDSVSELFLDHPHYSPTKKTYIVNALDQMTGAADRGIFLKRAALAPDEQMAFLMQRMAELMLSYHTTVAPAKRMVPAGRLVFLQRADGVAVGVVPLDHIIWRQTTAKRFAEMGAALDGIEGTTGKELWVEGTVSELFRENLTSQGWVIQEKARDKLEAQ
jgi:hypothetical protein